MQFFNLNALICSLALLALCETSHANSNPLTVHGFVSQGIVQSADNSFITDYSGISTELTEVGLNASYAISDDLRLTGQVVYLDRGNRAGANTFIDHLFIDWIAASDMDWQLNINLGRFQNSNWLYSNVLDVPHSRPSIFLPQSIYLDAYRRLLNSTDGINFKFNQDNELGELELNLSYGKIDLDDSLTRNIINRQATGSLDSEATYQANIFFTPINSNWQLGLSVFDSAADYQHGQNDIIPKNTALTNSRYIASLLYSAEKWEFAAELMQERVEVDRDIFKNLNHKKYHQSYYLQSRFFVNSELTLISRLEQFFADKDDRHGTELERQSNGRTPDYFAYQHDAMLGLSYRFTPKLQLQAEYHYFKGTGLITPLYIKDVANNPDKYWDLWAMQLSYWF